MPYQVIQLRLTLLSVVLCDVIVNCFILSAVHARIDLGQENVGAVVGSSIHMKCRGSYRSCEGIIWSRVEQPIGSPTVLFANNSMWKSYDGRYSVDVSADACVLSIDGLQLSDAGTFTCMDADYQSKMTSTVTVSGIL